MRELLLVVGVGIAALVVIWTGRYLAKRGRWELWVAVVAVGLLLGSLASDVSVSGNVGDAGIGFIGVLIGAAATFAGVVYVQREHARQQQAQVTRAATSRAVGGVIGTTADSGDSSATIAQASKQRYGPLGPRLAMVARLRLGVIPALRRSPAVAALPCSRA